MPHLPVSALEKSSYALCNKLNSVLFQVTFREFHLASHAHVKHYYMFNKKEKNCCCLWPRHRDLGSRDFFVQVALMCLFKFGRETRMGRGAVRWWQYIISWKCATSLRFALLKIKAQNVSCGSMKLS